MSLIRYYSWVGVLLFAPSLFIYVPAMMLVTWLVCQWLRGKVEDAFSKAEAMMPDELVPKRCDLDENLDEGTRICVGWAPLLPMIPVVIAVLGVHMSIALKD